MSRVRSLKLNINNGEGLKSRSELRCCSSYAFRDRSNLTVFRGQEPDDTVGLAQFLRTQNHGLIPVAPDHLPIFTFAARAGSPRHKIALGAERTPSAICLRDFRSRIVQIVVDYVKDLDHERSDIGLANALVCLEIGVELIAQRVLTPTNNDVDLVDRNSHVSRECDRRNSHQSRVAM